MQIRLRQEVLKEHIIRNNFSQRGFARKAKMSSGYLTQLLSGKRKPSGKVRKRLMDISGLNFDSLFTIDSAATTQEGGLDIGKQS